VPDVVRSNGRPERIALVLAGGGARGAYEIGALSALAPALEAHSQSPNVLVGTSIGALNTAFLAARAHEPLEDVAQNALEMWRELRWGDALRPLLSPSELRRLVGAGALLANLPGARVPGLLDPSPLRDTVRRFVAFRRIVRNVEDGTLLAAAVVATSYATTRSVVFHHGGPALGMDPVRAIEYMATPLAPEHVLASAAIPGAFPAVEVRRPRAAAGWYGDGGVRLNAPLAPALALGADRVVVIGLNSSVTPTRRSVRPDAIDGVAQLLQVVLSDQLAEDVGTLATVNETLHVAHQARPAEHAAPEVRPAAFDAHAVAHEAHAVAHEAHPASNAPTPGHEAGGGSRRSIPYIFIAPADRLEIGRLAREVHERHYGGVGSLVRSPSVALLGRIVNARRSAVHGELLSYLLLAPEFIDDLIDIGRRDAERWMRARHDAGLWQVGRLPVPRTAGTPAGARRRRSSGARRSTRRASARS
jgi:NTE family protein